MTSYRKGIGGRSETVLNLKHMDSFKKPGQGRLPFHYSMNNHFVNENICWQGKDALAEAFGKTRSGGKKISKQYDVKSHRRILYLRVTRKSVKDDHFGRKMEAAGKNKQHPTFKERRDFAITNGVSHRYPERLHRRPRSPRDRSHHHGLFAAAPARIERSPPTTRT